LQEKRSEKTTRRNAAGVLSGVVDCVCVCVCVCGKKRAGTLKMDPSESIHDVVVSFRFFHAARHFVKLEIAYSAYT